MACRLMRTSLATSLLLTGSVVSVGLVMSGVPALEFLLPGGLPLGNLVAAVALACLGAAAWVLAPARGLFRHLAKLTLVASASWLPVSILLAGNLRLNFANGRGDTWLTFTAAVLCASLLMLMLAAVLRLLSLRSRSPTKA